MIRSALQNPYLVIVVALLSLVIGVISLTKLPADLLPIYDTPAVQVVTFYPGMPPEVMERDIMSRLQRWTGQSVGIEHQEAKAMLGVCIVKDFFREDISLDTAMSQVTSYAVSDMFYLPPGTIPPMMMPFDPTASVPLCLIAISSTNTTKDRKTLEKELYDVAYYELRNRLQSIRGVIAPAVYGGTLRRILVYLDRQKLEARGLSLTDVQKAVLKHNVFIPAGNAKMGTLDFQIFTNAMPEKVVDINDIPIAYIDGEPIFVRDVGEAQDSNQIQTNVVRINGGRPAMYIPIYRQPGSNTIEIVDALNARLERILQRIKTMEPEKADGLQLNVVMDQSEVVRENIHGLELAGAIGALMAGLAVLLFLGSWRLTGIIVLAIPLSILVSLIGLFYSGDTINAMTLGGLALSIGILIDQAIVVLDNIVRHRGMGKSPVDAAVDGVKEVWLPLAVSILTFIVVFYPVVFLSGLARYLFTPLALAVTFAVLASYVVAIFFVPVCAVRLMGSRESGSEEQPRWLTALINGYGWLLRRNLRWKWTTVIVSAALAVVAFWWLGALCGQELFPQVDSGQFTIHVRLPSGTRIEKTEAAMAKIEKVVESVIGKPDPGYARGEEKHPDSNLQLHISNIGVLMDWPAAYTPNTGPMDAFLLVQLKGKAGMPGVFQYVEELRRQLNQKFPEIEFAFDTGGMLTAALNMGEPSPIHLQITGSNLATHQEIARAARAQIAQVPGAVDVRIYQRLDYPTLKIDIDRTKCADQGVTVEDVVKNLVSATNSSVNFMPAFWLDPRNGNHYFMGVQYYEQEITLDSIRYLPITGADSERPVLLENVAEIKQSTGPAVITHRNITRTTDIYANVLPGYDVGSVVAEIEHRLRTAPELASKITSTERGIEYEIIGRKADLAGTVKKVERNSDGKPVAVSIEPAGGGQRLSYRLDDRTKVNGVLAPRKPVVVWTTDDKQRLQRIDVTKSLIENENGLPGYYQDQGYTFAMMGEVRSMREAIRQFTAGLAIAAVLLFLVMVAMFRSFTTPFVVMMTVPLGMVGVAVALWATKTHLNVQSFMGIIMMMGIVVEYSIVLLDFADHRVRDGSAPEDAVYEAALVRFRPILMTSLTTILALLPMAAGFAGSEADQPLALAIVGGVVAATLLPKFVVPCLYALLKRPESAAEVADA